MTNYSSMKLEFLALKWALTLKFLLGNLLGQKCIVWTDNNPLSHLETAKLGAVGQPSWLPLTTPFATGLVALMLMLMLSQEGTQ